MSRESRLTAGILLILLPTVVFGGASILSLLIGDPEYARNQLRQDLWRAGHAHTGVLLILSLVTLRYADEAALSETLKRVVRHSIPAAAVLMPAAFFLSQSSRPRPRSQTPLYTSPTSARSRWRWDYWCWGSALFGGIELLREVEEPALDLLRSQLRFRVSGRSV